MDYEALGESWQRHLRANNLSPSTIETYLYSLRTLADFGSDDITAFLAHSVQHKSPSTAATYYRSLKQFFRWACEEGECDKNPMDGLKAPKIPDTPPPVLSEDETDRLLRACEGRDFAERRDFAIVSLFLDTGMRRAELSGLSVDDVDLDICVALVLGKGRRPRSCPFGHATARAIDRYLRARKSHRHFRSEALWVGPSGPMTPSGIYQAIEERGRAASVTVHPHLFRHTFAHRWLAAGGTEGDLMRLLGWRSRQMCDRYARSTAADRAIEAYRRLR